MGEHHILTSAHGVCFHAVELRDGIAVFVFTPGFFELTGGASLKGFSPQVGNQIGAVLLCYTKRTENGTTRVKGIDDRAGSIPSR